MITPVVAVFAGGTSAEREVSLGSGIACAQALALSFPTRFFQVDADAVPAGVDPKRHVVFSTLHGTFGEDGGMQRLLVQAGIEYAGCDAKSSALTMDKTATKAAVAKAGVQVIRGVTFEWEKRATAGQLVSEYGEDLVLKPNAEGSSVGLHIIETRAQLEKALSEPATGFWMIEQRIRGKELAVGVLDGRVLGVVEIRPKSGIYDYESKYTKGKTEYDAPAKLDADLTAKVQAAAKTAYEACGCRDYARVDFLLSGNNELFFLEINTLPGMKETSLLPMSARCVDLDFAGLVREMMSPALKRFRNATASATL